MVSASINSFRSEIFVAKFAMGKTVRETMLNKSNFKFRTESHPSLK